jgi:hypothetical protein
VSWLLGDAPSAIIAGVGLWRFESCSTCMFACSRLLTPSAAAAPTPSAVVAPTPSAAERSTRSSQCTMSTCDPGCSTTATHLHLHRHRLRRLHRHPLRWLHRHPLQRLSAAHGRVSARCRPATLVAAPQQRTCICIDTVCGGCTDTVCSGCTDTLCGGCTDTLCSG